MEEDYKKYFDIANYRRVVKLLNTPGWEEFSQVAKIAGAGILFVGAVGFLIFQIMEGFPLIRGLLRFFNLI